MVDDSHTTCVKSTISVKILHKNFYEDEEAARALLFKLLDRADTEINFNDQACQSVSFQEETVNPTEYLPHLW